MTWLARVGFVASTTPRNLAAGVIGLAVGALLYRFRRPPEATPSATA